LGRARGGDAAEGLLAARSPDLATEPGGCGEAT
jgi:hypothetical protein